MYKLYVLVLGCALSLTGCYSVKPVGEIGTSSLKVYSIASNDFVSASRMLVVLNKEGQVVAYSGGTVAGPGAIGLQAAGTTLSAAAIVYGSRSIQHGLENVNVKGIPSSVNVSTDNVIRIDPRQ